MAKETREAEERLKDETERASAAKSAAGRAAAAMADVAKKLTRANADKKTAEDELALLRSKIENLDKTVDDAAKATDARDAAVLQAAAAEQRARAADQRAEEAIAAAAETATENEERKRRFAKLQTSFKETEAALLARAEAAEKAIETKDNTPSAEMEQMVGEAIEEAESAARDAKDECARLQTETNLLHAELDAATTETNDLRRELSDVKNTSAVLEEMAKVRSETASMGGKKGGSTSSDIASIEAAAVKRGAEAASDEIKAATARAEAAEKNVNSLTAKLNQVSTQGSASRTESGTASEGLDDEATRVRLARVLSALRGGDKGVDSSLWSWAFGSSEENDAAASRSTSAGVGGGVGTDGNVPPLDALLADFESAVAPDGNRVGAWSNETLEQARRVAADAISRAEKAEKALSSRDESTAAAAVTAAASQGAKAKRAAAAETLVQEVAAKLQASEKRCRDLEWQVSMLVDKSELGGGSGGVQRGGSNGTGGPGAVAGGDAPRGPGQWLQKAIKGCVAPRPGRGGG